MESRPYHYSYHSLMYIEWGIDAITPSRKLEVALPLTSSVVYPECSLDEQGQRPLLVVSRRSTRSEKTQIADLPSGTMRRISRARSIVSGVELWHPAKPLLENRVEFVHCIVIIICCLSKTMFAKPVLFSNTPPFYSNIKNRVPGLLCFVRCQFAKTPFEIVI